MAFMASHIYFVGAHIIHLEPYQYGQHEGSLMSYIMHETNTEFNKACAFFSETITCLIVHSVHEHHEYTEVLTTCTVHLVHDVQIPCHF